MSLPAATRAPLDADPGQLGRLAIASLHAELVCAPKPGLVTPFDAGSHRDMDAATFMRSLLSLRGYFPAIAQAGSARADFGHLQQLGVEAEVAMSGATHGINTHRGAIFSLGLLVAGAASLRAHGDGTAAEAVCNEVMTRWGASIVDAPSPSASHGQNVARRYGAKGARGEAACGFPTLRNIALPTLRHALATTTDQNAAMVQTLMTLVANTEDTNLLHRGGASGLAYAQRRSREFLAAGGISASGWEEKLVGIGRDFVTRRLSPGGSADLLACTWFLIRLERSVT
jgi:triphosphoribosyl-dephospho-CoA synthase